jgi:hypothetical protein
MPGKVHEHKNVFKEKKKVKLVINLWYNCYIVILKRKQFLGKAGTDHIQLMKYLHSHKPTIPISLKHDRKFWTLLFHCHTVKFIC